MTRRPPTRLWIGFAFALLGAWVAAHDLLRIDYYVWNRHRTNWPPADLRAIQALDVLIYFRTDNPDDSGRVSFPPEAIAHLQDLKAVTKPTTKILLGVYDIGSLIGSPERLAGFLASVRELSAAHGFAGLDIDWEDAAISTADYAALVSAISTELRGPDFLVTNSVGTSPLYIAKTQAVKDVIDWTHVQFYYSTLNSWSVAQMAESLARFDAAGVPANKIAIGLPLYGMQDMRNYTAGPSGIGYRQMIEAGADPNANLWTHPTTGHTYHYSGVPLTRDKVAHAVDGGYRGVFTWELTLDTNYRSETSILRAIDQQLAGEEPTSDAAELQMQSSLNLSNWTLLQKSFLTTTEAALEYRLRIGRINSVDLQDPGFESRTAGSQFPTTNPGHDGGWWRDTTISPGGNGGMIYVKDTSSSDGGTQAALLGYPPELRSLQQTVGTSFAADIDYTLTTYARALTYGNFVENEKADLTMTLFNGTTGAVIKEETFLVTKGITGAAGDKSFIATAAEIAAADAVGAPIGIRLSKSALYPPVGNSADGSIELRVDKVRLTHTSAPGVLGLRTETSADSLNWSPAGLRLVPVTAGTEFFRLCIDPLPVP